MRYLLLLSLLTVFLSCNRQATRLEQSNGGPVGSPAPAPAATATTPDTRDAELRMEDSPDLRATIKAAEASPDVDRKPTPISAKNPNWERRKQEAARRGSPESTTQTTASVNNRMPEGNIPPVDVKALQAPVLFTMRKTPCYGDCPVYSLSILESEVALLNAKKGTAKAGKQVKQLGHFDYTDLVTQFRNVVSTGLADRYPVEGNVPVDIAFTELTFTDEDGKQRIVQVYGDAPEPLAIFIKSLEELASGYGWQ